MKLLPIVKYIESPSSAARFATITGVLETWEIPFEIQHYNTGKNIIIYPAGDKPVIGISSHFDVVIGSPGANDNSSSIAVCLGILKKLQTHKFADFNVAVFFFDEEETGLKGSQAYLNKYKPSNMQSLINLEMTGQGDKFALWPTNERSQGRTLDSFEKIAGQKGIFCGRFDKIVTNYADHVSFINAGLKDVFTVTCISSEDLVVAKTFYEAQGKGASLNVLQQIISQAPLFSHYHQPTDLAEHLNEDSLQMALNAVWETLIELDK